VNDDGDPKDLDSSRRIHVLAGRHKLVLVHDAGPWGGPVYAYRGAEIWVNATQRRWQVWIEDHPLRGLTLHSMARAIRIIDAWIDGRRLPPP